MLYKASGKPTIPESSRPSPSASRPPRLKTKANPLQQLQYFLWEVVDVLTIVEAPQVTVPTRAPWSSEKENPNDEPPKVSIKQERQITSSLRTTTRHLHKTGGITAPLRGLACSLCTILAIGSFLALSAALGLVLENPRTQWDTTITSRLVPDLREFAVETFAFLLFSPWLAACVHVVLTQPTLRIWYRRLPPFLPTLRATWRPLLLCQVADFAVWKVLPRPLRWAAGFYMASYEPAQGIFTSDNILRSLFWLIVHAAYLLTSLPLYIACVRVQASLLPEEEETIVPFDRTFGTSGANGLRPGLLAEARGPLTLREAWGSVTWAEVRRVVVMRAKFVAVEVAVSALFCTVLGAEAFPNKWVPWKYNS